MAFSLKDNLTFTGTGTSSSVHLNNLANGDTALVGISVNQGTTDRITSVTDSSGNTYTKAGSYTNGTNQEVELWYSINATLNNGTTWTVTPSNGAFIWSASIYIFSGLGTTGVFDKKAGASGTGTTNVDSGATATTSNANELIIGLGGGPHNRPWSAGSGYTSINQAANGSNASVFSEYKTVSATGVYNATGSIDISNDWVMGEFTFTDAALGASIAPDAFSKIATPATASPATWSHTCTGSNLALIVLLEVKTTTSSISAVTYNGVSLTKITGASIVDATNAINYEVWYLLNPATGANTISVTWTTGASRRLLGVAISLSGVGALDASNTASGTVAGTTPQPSVSLTTIANNCYVVGGVGVNDNGALTGGTSQTLFNQINDATTPFHSLAGSYRGAVTPAGSTTINFAGAFNTDSWVIGAASFSPVTNITTAQIMAAINRQTEKPIIETIGVASY